MRDTSFYLQQNVDGEVHLSQTPNYYSQVQGQLEVCDKQYCDFVCWTNKGVHVERILRDRSSFEHIKPSLDHFFQEALLPCILCGSDFTFKENVASPEDEGEVFYCWCQEPEFGKMIGCDNDFCEYEWFHYSCVGITRKP